MKKKKQIDPHALMSKQKFNREVLELLKRMIHENNEKLSEQEKQEEKPDETN